MLLHPANFLLLDEPTNHLDMRAKDVLLEALMKYTGTVVFVSHDRYFIDKLATRVFEIGDGKVELYPGNYEDYLWRKQGGAEKQTASITNELVAELSARRSSEAKQSASRSQKSAGNREASLDPSQSSGFSSPTNGNASETDSADSKGKRLNPIKRKQMQDRLREVEEGIARMEAAIVLCETQLQSFVSAETTQRQTQELATHRSDLQALMSEWEELSGELS
jgi:ATP-binding cassette subfamily F protein 3